MSAKHPSPCQNIALIGFMGAGKSTVGRLVAAHLHFQFLDTDHLIEKEAGKSISQIFDQDGEEAFRKQERQVVQNLAQLQETVISTGGGVGASEEHLASLKTHALVVCLWVSPEIIWRRVKSQTHRPLLQTPDPQKKIQEILDQREPVYRQADVIINADIRSAREVAHQVVHQFEQARQDRANSGSDVESGSSSGSSTSPS